MLPLTELIQINVYMVYRLSDNTGRVLKCLCDVFIILRTFTFTSAASKTPSLINGFVFTFVSNGKTVFKCNESGNRNLTYEFFSVIDGLCCTSESIVLCFLFLMYWYKKMSKFINHLHNKQNKLAPVRCSEHSEMCPL